MAYNILSGTVIAAEKYLPGDFGSQHCFGKS